MKRPYAIILQGATGVGKTTIGRKLATSYPAASLEADYFMMGMLPHRPLTDQHIQFGSHCLMTCLKECIRHQLSVVLEGVLIKDKRSEIDLPHIITTLTDAGYQVHRFKLTAPYQAALKRMEQRPGWEGHKIVVTEAVFDELTDALKSEVPATVRSIPTENKSVDEVVRTIVKIIEAD